MVFTLLFIENPLLVVFSPILSFIDEKYKESLILTLLHQCYEICSKNALIHAEIDNLRKIFQNNGYPVLFMDKWNKMIFEKVYRGKVIVLTVSKKEVKLILPYLGTRAIDIKNSCRWPYTWRSHEG